MLKTAFILRYILRCDMIGFICSRLPFVDLKPDPVTVEWCRPKKLFWIGIIVLYG